MALSINERALAHTERLAAEAEALGVEILTLQINCGVHDSAFSSPHLLLRSLVMKV